MNLMDRLRHNPFPFYRLARLGGGVHRFGPRGVWMAFRYQDVKVVLSDFERFSSQMGAEGNGPPSLISTDPPRHTRLRSLVNRAFTPKAVAALEPRIASLAAELLDGLARRPAFDLVGDLAMPLPVRVIAEMLGVADGDRAAFKHWSDLVVASADQAVLGEGGLPPDYADAMAAMRAYFGGVVAARRAQPQTDLISGLVAAEIEGDRLSAEDIFNFCWLLLVAGNETTTNLITNAVRCLMERPALWRRLRAEPELIPAAVEETLRLRSPVQAMIRFARQDVRMGRHTIPAGAMVIPWIGSANRDPARFPEPGRFRLGRSPNPHLAFGHGIHTCLGAPLARVEARIALEGLLRRYPVLQRADRERLEPVTGFILHGVKRLALQAV